MMSRSYIIIVIWNKIASPCKCRFYRSNKKSIFDTMETQRRVFVKLKLLSYFASNTHVAHPKAARNNFTQNGEKLQIETLC